MSDGIELRIEISIQDYRAGGGLRLSEQVMIPESDFGTMAEIMARFHEVLQAIKAARDRP